MTALRVSLAIVVTAAGVTALHHHKPRHAASAQFAPVVPYPSTPKPEVRDLPSASRRPPVRRASRGHTRPPIGVLADTTMYCATGNRNAAGLWPQLGDVAVADRSIPFGTRVLINGNVYVVRDWVGSGSDFDLYGGSDAGCEQRALNYGRQHLRVVVER